jgi:hypothetical protein
MSRFPVRDDLQLQPRNVDPSGLISVVIQSLCGLGRATEVKKNACSYKSSENFFFSTMFRGLNNPVNP